MRGALSNECPYRDRHLQKRDLMSSTPNITNIIVVMLENRSYDNVQPAGEMYRPQPAILCLCWPRILARVSNRRTGFFNDLGFIHSGTHVVSQETFGPFVTTLLKAKPWGLPNRRGGRQLRKVGRKRLTSLRPQPPFALSPRILEDRPAVKAGLIA